MFIFEALYKCSKDKCLTFRWACDRLTLFLNSTTKNNSDYYMAKFVFAL